MRRTSRLVIAVTLLTGAVLAAAATRPSDFYEVTPGPTPTVADAVTVTRPVNANPQRSTGAIHITTIAARRLSHWESLRCQMRPGCTAVARASHGYSGAEQDQMASSIDAATAASRSIAGEQAKWPGAPGTLRVDGIGGPSAGLALTLDLLQQQVPGDLTGGHTIAATGTIDSRGNVGAVGGVPYKTRGARRIHADVFFVPADEASQVPTGTGMAVVPVTTANDAVRWLCEHAATSALCADGQRS